MNGIAPPRPSNRSPATRKSTGEAGKCQDTTGRPAWSAVPTAGMLAEPEPEPEQQREQPPVGQMAMQALNRERAKRAETEAALRTAQDEVASLKAQVEQVRAELARRAETPSTASGDGNDDVDALRSAVERADVAESSAVELQSKVSELAAELEEARADAVAAGVALERLSERPQSGTTTLAVAEERAERLAAEVQQLRTRSAKEPTQVGRWQSEAMSQVESVLAENRRWPASSPRTCRARKPSSPRSPVSRPRSPSSVRGSRRSLASMRDTEGQQAGVVDALQAAVKERDAELDALRQQLPGRRGQACRGGSGLRGRPGASVRSRTVAV